MGYIQLPPDSCSHCFNKRRQWRERKEAEGATPEFIAAHASEVLCDAHTDIREELAAKERRRRARRGF